MLLSLMPCNKGKNSIWRSMQVDVLRSEISKWMVWSLNMLVLMHQFMCFLIKVVPMWTRLIQLTIQMKKMLQSSSLLILIMKAVHLSRKRKGRKQCFRISKIVNNWRISKINSKICFRKFPVNKLVHLTQIFIVHISTTLISGLMQIHA